MPGTNRWEEAPLVTAYPTRILKDTECTGKKQSSGWKIATCVEADQGKASRGAGNVAPYVLKSKWELRRFSFLLKESLTTGVGRQF